MSHAIRKTSASLFLATVIIAVAVPTSAQRAATPDLAPRRSVQTEIVEIAGKPATREGAVLELLYRREGVDVKIRAEGVASGDPVYLLAKNRDETQYQVYGPAVLKLEGDREVYLVPDVVLPHLGPVQMKHFSLRSVVAPAGMTVGRTVTSLNGFSAISMPSVEVAVLSWSPAASSLSIDTVGGRPVEAHDQFVAEASADVGGSRDAAIGRLPIFLVVHAVNSNAYNLVGPAEESGDTWFCRDVRFAGSAQPHTRYVDLWAVQSSEPLAPGPIGDWTRLRRTVRASPSVRIFVKDEQVPPPQRATTIELTTVITSTGRSIAVPADADRVRLDDVEVSLDGTFRDLGQGKSIVAIFNPVGSGDWIVADGPALIGGGRWRLPRVRFEAIGERPATEFRLILIATDAALPAGVIEYAVWQPLSSGASKPILVQRVGGAASALATESPRIASVGGRDVDGSSTVVAPGRGPIVVKVDDMSDTAHVWIGSTACGSDEWTFVKAIKQDDLTWASLPAWTDERARSGGCDAVLVAIVTHGPLPVAHGPADWWRRYAWSVSPFVTVEAAAGGATDPSARSAARSDSPGVSLAGPQAKGDQVRRLLASEWTPWLLALGVLILVEYAGRVVSNVATLIATTMEELGAYLREQVRRPPRLRPVRSVLGLTLLGLGVCAIWFYLPLYGGVVLRGAFHLSAAYGKAIAVMMVICTAVIGFLIELTVRYGRPGRSSGRPDQPTRPRGAAAHFAYAAVLTVLVLSAAALLAFQASTYASFYSAKADPGSYAPFAMATAAMIASAAEMLNAAAVSYLLQGSAAWIAVNVFLILPPQLVRFAARIVAIVFRALPSRADAGVAAPTAGA